MKQNFFKRILILCEDKKSSVKYFKHFLNDEKLKRNLSSISIEIYHPKKHQPIELVKEAKRRQQTARKEKNSFDEIWIIMDHDNHPNLKQAFDMAKAQKKIYLALSIICFEIWLLLHFEKKAPSVDKCSQMENELKKYLKSYKKNIRQNDIEKLFDKIPKALEDAEWLENQNRQNMVSGTDILNIRAYTDVHKIVKKLYCPAEYLH